ncbi:ATP-dependent DNA helicase, partial [Sporosarcina sp. BP05]|uniref:ATP-dependent DNA helicase n=1 Tax=Sporosarcina sp. BP05 TaxID=2758726 RepID=UPI00164801C0
MRYTSLDIDNLGYKVSYLFFEKQLPSLGYSVRKPQIEYTEDILNMLKNRSKCLIIEAEVGTGKSFGYLAPLLQLQSVDRGGFSVVISTGTIALQEQLMEDIKLLKDYMGLSINPVLAKGMSHFLCKSRINQRYGKQTNKPDWINDWTRVSEYGDKVDLNKLIPDINDVWGKVNVSKCSFRKCAFFSECKYMELRDRMKKNNSVIVTNHDQLIANAKSLKVGRNPLFPLDTSIIIIDEAHNLEEKARNSLSESWGLGEIKDLLYSIGKFLSRSDNYEENEKTKERILIRLERVFHNLYLYCIQKSGDDDGNDIQTFKIELTHEDEIDILIEDLNNFNISAQLLDVENDELDDTLYKSEVLISFLNDIIEQHNRIYWLEMKKNNNKSLRLNSIPKEMGEIIHNYLFEVIDKPIILTSATISQPGITNYDKYDYLINSLGMDSLTTGQLAVADPKPSPFNYDSNALIYIPNDLPSRKEKDQYKEAAFSEILRLLKLTDGRAMILFTSKEDMMDVYKNLRVLNLPWNILVQVEGSSQNEIKDQFIEDEKSVLLSTGIFWEGMNIPGPSLSNLIIYKLPFPVPHPILDYKSSLVDDGFSQVYIPEMLIKLRQGLGRLIRK